MNLLSRFPRRAPFAGVVARAQHLGDGVVIDAAPVHLPAERVERGLDRDFELDKPLAQVGRYLVRGEGVVEHVELARDQRVEPVGLPASGRDRRERVRIAEQLATFELEPFASRRGFGRGVRVRFPPCFGQCGLDRSEL